MDHEGFPTFSLQDQNGADIGVGQLQSPFQGDRKQVFAVECDVAEVGEFLQGGQLGGPFFKIAETVPEFMLDGLKRLDDLLQFVGGNRPFEAFDILRQRFRNRS
jgi:hypothetical protein